jgi:hypothetical protein
VRRYIDTVLPAIVVAVVAIHAPLAPIHRTCVVMGRAPPIVVVGRPMAGTAGISDLFHTTGGREEKA